MGPPEDVTQLLLNWSEGDQAALDQLIPIVHGEMRRLAASYLRRERPGHTLQPTALVNEAYLRLIDQRNARWHNRAQFFGVAAQIMRRILVDYARQHEAEKRGGPEQQRISLSDAEQQAGMPPLDLLALNEALHELEAMDPQQSRIVELRFFAGLTIAETAEVLDIGHATVEREWTLARAWLRRRLQ
jgi:RNA polymerase sigma-70 factor (ECF subfamily)